MKALIVISLWVAILGGVMTAPPAVSAEEKTNINKLVENAQTAQDHRAIAAYYTSQAAQAKTKASEHTEMAKYYRSWRQINKSRISYKNPEHCLRLVKSYNAQADEYFSLAKEHESIASDLEKNAQ